MNLLYYEKDHGISAEWHFFTTSHGKGPCDGIGGTVKLLVYHASLQMNKILNINEMVDWCQENITEIVFLKNIQSPIKEYIVPFNLYKRYGQAQQIHDWRVHHHFTPVDGVTEIRLISADDLQTAIQPSFEYDRDVAHICSV